jgi:hypothetical protein
MSVISPVAMLWFDNTAEDLSNPKKKLFDTKLKEAVDYYRKKYNLIADLCEINDDRFATQLSYKNLPDNSEHFDVGGVRVVPRKGILPWDMHIFGDRRHE